MDNKGNQNKNGKNPRGQNYAVLIMTMLFTLLCVAMMHNLWQGSRTHKMPYSEFNQMLKDHEVESVVIGNGKIQITPKEDSKKYGGSQGKYGNLVGMEYYTIPINDPDLEKKLDEAGVTTYEQAEVDATGSIIMLLLEWVLPIAAMFVIFNMMMKRMGGGGGIMGVGKSNAKVYVQKETGVTFKDVAGEDEAKESLTEIVDFLHNPGKYTKIGAKLPKGALLVGPPGTGKTLLAKAVAGEAKVPFFSLSGSDFVEMFVGVGASRVRDLFKQAQQSAPCIIFIDEVDAIGKSRDSRLGGNDEREQTLNQMLVQMDGFETGTNVIVIAATNRPDVLDQALLRPGRFDRQVVVPLPDIRGREQILNVHMKKVPVATDVQTDVIARGTPGFSGADLANLVNEAALFAARRNGRVVSMADFELAKDKIMMGAERKSMVMNEDEKKNTAYHESGHALVAKLMPKSDPVHKVTIIPRGRALGVTMQLPEEDRYAYDKQYLLTRIAILFGGRIAEEVFMHQMTTGASNDFERATQLARDMVTRYGMSDKMGIMVYVESETDPFLSRAMPRQSNISEETMRAVDLEIRHILETQYAIARKLIEDNRDKMEAMAQALLKWETIDADQIDDIMAGKPPREPRVIEPPKAETKAKEPDEKTPEAEAKPVTEPAADDKSAETAPETGVKSDVKAEPKSDAQ